MKYERALILGASGGIGSALADALKPADVVTLSRSEDGFDLLSEASIAGFAESIPGPFDLIIDATGALEIDGTGPEKSVAAINPEVMARQFAINAIGPALIFKHFMGHLPKDSPCMLVSLSARVGSIGDNRLGGWISYRAAKAALNQIIKTTSIELSRTHKQSICVAIHPGTVKTPLTQKYVGNHPAVTTNEAALNILTVLSVLDVADTGGFFDWKGDRIEW